MGTQRKLNALLFELQTAGSPLAQAKVLARAWRTVRELSPTDRLLLARHAGFDGAEEILEGLAKKKSGVAPAMLLQMLSNARGTDASTLRNLLSALRDPARRDEAVARSLDLASELMSDQQPAAPAEEVGEALGELQAVELEVEAVPEEALAALYAVESQMETSPTDTVREPDRDTVSTAEIERPPPVAPEPEAAPEKPQSEEPPVVDWSRWDSGHAASRPAPTPRNQVRPPVSDPGARRIGEVAAATAVGVESSVFARLRALHRGIAGLVGSNVETVGELVEDFPDGWVRRRALSALIEAGAPARADDAVTLIASPLDGGRDRRGGLGVLAARGDLRGAPLERAIELLGSPAARKRLSASANQSVAE